MKNNGINNLLIKADNICDYIPVISTVNNLIDIFQKSAIIPRLGYHKVAESRYFTHLEQKSFTRCIVLLVPVLGNVVIGLSDSFNKVYKNRALKFVNQNGESLKSFKYFKNDRDVVLAAIEKTPSAIQFASRELQQDSDMQIAAEKSSLNSFKKGREEKEKRSIQPKPNYIFKMPMPFPNKTVSEYDRELRSFLI